LDAQEDAMNAQVKAIVPALALVAALALPSVAAASDRHGSRHGRRSYSAQRHDSRGYRGHYTARPYADSYRYRSYRPRYYGGYDYAPAPYAYGYYGYGYAPYAYDAPYGYYPPPPRYRRVRPHLGLSLYLGF
jgi:hypothetical protein